MTPQAAAQALPDELAAELAGLTFADIGAATAAVNNGLRAKYLNRLYQHASAGSFSDRLVSDIGTAINSACDRAVAEHAPIQCAETGWTSFPR